METSTFVSLLTSQFLPQLPLWLVWVAGIILAAVLWPRHPLPSLLTVLALVLLLLQSVFGTLAYAWVISQRVEAGLSDTQMGMRLAVLTGVRTLATAVGYGLLLGAVFGWRRRAIPGGGAGVVEVVEAVPETSIRRDPER